MNALELTRENARLYVELACNNPIVQAMEESWRDPETEDGAGCMAAYISHGIQRLLPPGVDVFEHYDLLREAILARWETM